MRGSERTKREEDVNRSGEKDKWVSSVQYKENREDRGSEGKKLGEVMGGRQGKEEMEDEEDGRERKSGA